jgi:diaminopimelate epimerase
MRYEKWDALGNPYLVVEQPDAGPLDERRVRGLCSAATGPGSDGVLEVLATDVASAEVVVWNPDGSVAETSGNGTRIAARWLAARTGAGEVTVTSSGREVAVRMLGEILAETDMGDVAVGAPEQIDVGEEVSFVPVSVGNPHAVIRRDGASEDDLLRLGPRVERHERFPERTNVQLVQPLGEHDLRVLVWERGAGATRSSGSSSVAAAAAAVARGWCSSPVTVHLPGGSLTVTLSEGRAGLVGPAVRVASAETDL